MSGYTFDEGLREQFSREEMLLGPDALERLASARVAVFGIGGVGGYVCEALVRSGLGAIDLIDDDDVALSNLNRQIIALRSTVGRPKTLVMRERLLDINPSADVREHRRFLLAEKTNTEIADTLSITEGTVKYHIHNLLQKTGCRNRIVLLSLYYTGEDE